MRVDSCPAQHASIWLQCTINSTTGTRVLYVVGLTVELAEKVAVYSTVPVARVADAIEYLVHVLTHVVCCIRASIDNGTYQ